MRVYVPNKNESIIKDILKELYILRQSIDYDSSTTAVKLQLCDKIRAMIQTLKQGEQIVCTQSQLDHQNK